MSGPGGRLRRLVARSVLIAACALLAGCTGGPSTSPSKPTPEPTPVRPSADAPPIAVAFAPLRGTLADGAAMRHPSIAVKIDNHEEARPQIALNRSDIAYEELVEGGLTRYAVVWHSDVPDEVGPVRSIRPMDPDIMAPFLGPIAYSGGQEVFVAMAEATGLPNLVFDYDDTGLFSRADERPGPHDVIFRAAEAVSRYPDLPTPPVQFAYGSADPLAEPRFAAGPSSRIDLVFSEERYPSWEWDPASRVWLRSQEGDPDVEASGERVRATNVVTLRVAIDWTYGEVPKTVLAGSGGEAWASVGGRTAHGSWSKAGQADPIVLVADDGSPLYLAPGNTWVELVPLDGSAAFTP